MIVMVVCLLLFGDLLVALSLCVSSAGPVQIGPPRVFRAHGKHRQESFEVMTLARRTRRRARVAHQGFEYVTTGSTFEFVERQFGLFVSVSLCLVIVRVRW